MNRELPQFLDRLEWNLVAREGYTVVRPTEKTYIPIPARTFLVESFVFIIGIKSATAKVGWFTGGWVSMLLPFSPSTTSNFVAATHIYQRRLRLGVLNYVAIPKIANSSYLLEIKFPEWLESVEIEVWRYDGEDITAIEKLNRIEATLNEL